MAMAMAMAMEDDESTKEKCSVPSPSVIEILLGRAPVSHFSSSASSPSLFTMETSLKKQREKDVLIHLEEQCEEEALSMRNDVVSLNIIDRLNEAIRQAQYADDVDRRNRSEHRIAVQT